MKKNIHSVAARSAVSCLAWPRLSPLKVQHSAQRLNSKKKPKKTKSESSIVPHLEVVSLNLTERSENTPFRTLRRTQWSETPACDHLPPSNVKADLLSISLAAYLSKRSQEESRHPPSAHSVSPSISWKRQFKYSLYSLSSQGKFPH